MIHQHAEHVLDVQKAVVGHYHERQPIAWKFAVGETAQHAIDLSGLNHVVDYPHRDMTITVEAGMTLAALQEILSEHAQWLPVDAPWPETLTVAEALLLDLNGSLAAGSGTFRDWILGVAAVDGQGRLFHSGGRVVKNVAGYDLGKLIVGSGGELAMPLEVTLQVRPRPVSIKQVSISSTSVEQARELWTQLRSLKLSPAAFEFNDQLQCTMAVAGTAEIVESLLDDVTAACQQISGVTEQGSLERSDWKSGSGWDALRLAPPRQEANVLLRLVHAPSETVRMLAALREEGWRAIANASRGITYATRDWAEFDAQSWPLLAERFTSTGTTVVPLAGPDELFVHADRERQSRSAWSIQEAIKAEFDPAGVFSRIKL